MKYKSTRGGVSGLSFGDVLFSGYASDGGLFVPEIIPQITPETLNSWRDANLSYMQVVSQVVRLFIPPSEMENVVLENCVQQAYTTFALPDVINFHSCKAEAPGKNPGKGEQASWEAENKQGAPPSHNTFIVAELFHGKTASFKDLALSLIGQFMAYFVEKRKSHVTLLIGTSGDTGSAAIEAVRGLRGVDVVVLYPLGKVTRVQELQMITVGEDNVHVYGVEGTSDDLDVPIKQSFPQQGLASINSINWARVMIQIAHYVHIYLREGRSVNVIVPTGAGGNVVAGVIANLMGIPIKLYVATNSNDSFYTMLTSATLRMGGDVITTPANAMDIRYPYNVERLFSFFSSDPSQISQIMEKAESEHVPLPDNIINPIRNIIKSSMVVDDTLIYQTISQVWRTHAYMICPHTATGVALYYKQFHNQGSSNQPVYILSTASPSKFPESAREAGIPQEEWDGEELLRHLATLPQKPTKLMRVGEDWFEILQNQINSIKNTSTS